MCKEIWLGGRTGEVILGGKRGRGLDIQVREGLPKERRQLGSKAEPSEERVIIGTPENQALICVELASCWSEG